MKKNWKRVMTWQVIIVSILIAIGIYQILSGETSSGSSLIGGAVGVFIALQVKRKRVKRLEDEGLSVYDERTFYVVGRAAHATMYTFWILSAIFILFGAAFGPEVLVNPYDLAGVILGIVIIIYFGFYYYFNKKN